MLSMLCCAVQGGVSADVLQEQLRASHAQTQSLREELAAARAEALETQKLRE